MERLEWDTAPYLVFKDQHAKTALRGSSADCNELVGIKDRGIPFDILVRMSAFELVKASGNTGIRYEAYTGVDGHVFVDVAVPAGNGRPASTMNFLVIDAPDSVRYNGNVQAVQAICQDSYGPMSLSASGIEEWRHNVSSEKAAEPQNWYQIKYGACSESKSPAEIIQDLHSLGEKPYIDERHAEDGSLIVHISSMKVDGTGFFYRTKTGCESDLHAPIPGRYR